MKKIIIIIPFLISICNSQIKDLSRQQYFTTGSFEFSFFTNIGKSITTIKEKTESTGSPAYDREYKQEDIHAHIGASAGYYFIDKLSFEPELDIDLSSDYSSFAVIGNLSYSFSKAASNITPYVKIGYGWGEFTSESYWGNRADSDGFMVINTGAGVKIRYSESMIFKMEINYRILNTSISYTYSIPEYDSSNKSEMNINVISLSLGTSFLF